MRPTSKTRNRGTFKVRNGGDWYSPTVEKVDTTSYRRKHKKALYKTLTPEQIAIIESQRR